MLFLDRLRRQTDPAGADKLTVGLRGVLDPECLERLQGLVGVAAARVERRAEDLKLFFRFASQECQALFVGSNEELRRAVGPGAAPGFEGGRRASGARAGPGMS